MTIATELTVENTMYDSDGNYTYSAEDKEIEIIFTKFDIRERLEILDLVKSKGFKTKGSYQADGKTHYILVEDCDG